MGTMRNNFATVFVLHVLMLTTSQSLPHGYENSSRRNNLADDLTPDDRTVSNPIYNCLFIDPDLPICDVERMLNSDEKTTEPTNTQQTVKDFLIRSRRNADVSASTRVVVYTIEGCIPPRLPFSLPSCNGISLDNIVDVQRLRPFAVKGVTQSPFVFPEFDYPKWIRMMTRLQSHISSVKQDEPQNTVPKEISIDDPLQDITTSKKTILNMLSLNKSLPPDQKSRKSKNKNHKSRIERISSSKSKKFGSKETSESSATSSNEDANNDPEIDSKNANDRSIGRELPLEKPRDASATKLAENFEEKQETTDNRAQNVWKWDEERDQPVIPPISMVPDFVKQSDALVSKDGSLDQQPAVEEPPNHLGTGRNSRSFSKTTKEKESDAWNDTLCSKLRCFERKRREIRLSGKSSLQGIADDSKVQGIVGKSIARRFQGDDFEGTSRSGVSNEERDSKSPKMEKHGIASVKDASTTAIPGLDTEDHRKKSKLDNPRLKIDLASRKASWRRALMKDAALGKKHRTYMELPTSRSQ